MSTLLHNRQCQPTHCGTSTEHYCLLVPLTQHRERPATNAVFILAHCRLGSRTMPPPTDTTRHAAPMTSPEWWVTPEAGY